MGIFDRLSTVLKSNINDLIDKAEDPEKMLKQLMIDMERDLIEVRKEVAMAIQTEKRLHQQYTQNLKQAEGWEKPALPVRGRDLEEIGVTPGKAMGDLLRRLEIEWIDSGFTLDRNALLERGANLRET